MASWELDQICRLCLTTKKDMRNIYGENIINMLEEFSTIKIERLAGWPDKICGQCVHQVSRCHSFKKRIEKSDEQLKQYIKSLTVIVEEPVVKEQIIPQQRTIAPQEIKTQQIAQPIQEIQIQRPEQQQQQQQQQQQTIQQAHPLIIANVLNNPTTTMLNGQQLIQTANGQLMQIGQFLQGPNNTIQMIATNPNNVGQQVLQLRADNDNRCELIVQPSTDLQETQYYEDIPVIVQSANGQQSILNLPHHQIQQLQQQAQQQQQQQQQVQMHQMSNSEPSEIEIHEVQDFDEEYACDDLEEIVDEVEETEQEIEAISPSQSTYIVQTIEENSETDQDEMDKQLLAEFLAQQTHSEGPGKHFCNLCQQEFKHLKWLHSHMKSIHINWIKANCKKQPQCQLCFKSFRGPGMLKMHMKTHTRENKLPTCTICSKEFKSKSILYRHRSTHFQKVDHRCNICNKSFSSNYQLNAHLTRHQKKNASESESPPSTKSNSKKVAKTS